MTLHQSHSQLISVSKLGSAPSETIKSTTNLDLRHKKSFPKPAPPTYHSPSMPRRKKPILRTPFNTINNSDLQHMRNEINILHRQVKEFTEGSQDKRKVAAYRAPFPEIQSKRTTAELISDTGIVLDSLCTSLDIKRR